MTKLIEKTLSQDYIKEHFEYKDGELYWKKKPSKKSIHVKVGNLAGTICDNLYKQVSLGGKFYYTHRLIFAMFYGYFPKSIDHIDRNPQNNKIENLREATQSQNNYNASIRKDNTSGFKNVYWDKRRNQWVVMIKVNKKNKHIGYYDSFQEAKESAIKARNLYCGEFAS